MAHVTFSCMEVLQILFQRCTESLSSIAKLYFLIYVIILINTTLSEKQANSKWLSIIIL